LDGRRISLLHLPSSTQGTRFVRAVDCGNAEFGGAAGLKWYTHAPGSAVQVAVERTLAGRRAALVSAASAYHAGGGFSSGGRHAMEEALCMQTTLFKSLLIAEDQAQNQDFAASPCTEHNGNEQGHAWQRHIPDDGVILSPDIEVFRGGTSEGYPFLRTPVKLCAVVSVAMPNCNPNVRDAPCDRPAEPQVYTALLSLKFIALLTAAQRAGADVLVIPDVGCGVYGNDPRAVGSALGEVLHARCAASLREVHLVGSSEFASATMWAGVGSASNADALRTTLPALAMGSNAPQ